MPAPEPRRQPRKRTSITVDVDVYAEAVVFADERGISVSRLMEYSSARLMVEHGVHLPARLLEDPTK